MTVTPEHTVCAYPWQQMNIDLTGEVVPCCFWTGYGNSGKPLGNTNEQTIEEIWNGEKYQALRRDLVNEEPDKQAACQGCDMPYDASKFTPARLVRAGVTLREFPISWHESPGSHLRLGSAARMLFALAGVRWRLTVAP